MYYRKALELQAFLDMAKDEGKYWENCVFDNQDVGYVPSEITSHHI